MSDGKATFTLRGFVRGAVAAQPMGVGVFVYGLAFGVVARQADLSALEAVLTSAAVFSGSAQLAAAGAIGAAPSFDAVGVWALAALILVTNARYVLYGATYRPWLGGLRAREAYPTLFFTGDGAYVITMAAHAEGERDGAFVMGCGALTFVLWCIGTGLGAAASGLLPWDPSALGLDFMLAGFATALGAKMVRARADVVTIAVAVAVALATDAVLPGGWGVVAAGLAGGALAALRHRPEMRLP
jgi:predicted branched-subunit amino acid permease